MNVFENYAANIMSHEAHNYFGLSDSQAETMWQGTEKMPDRTALNFMTRVKEAIVRDFPEVERWIVISDMADHRAIIERRCPPLLAIQRLKTQLSDNEKRIDAMQAHRAPSESYRDMLAMSQKLRDRIRRLEGFTG